MSGIRIRKLHVRPLNFKLDRPLETAGGQIGSWPVVILDMHTDAGIVGVSFVGCFMPMLVKPVVSLLQDMGAMIEGDELSPVSIEAKLRAKSRLIGTQGPIAMAVAMIEISAWDALSKASNLPLCRLLGAKPRAHPVYLTIPAMTPSRVRELAQRALELQYAGVKCKLGHPDPSKDLALIDAVRSVCGPNFPIMVDYNQSLSVPDAIQRIQRLDDMGLGWIEEPTDAMNVEGHVKIANAVKTPVSLGENWHNPMEAARDILSGAADVVMPDVLTVGGISAWLKCAALAEIRGIPISAHSYPEISTQLLPLAATPHWLEHAEIFDSLFLNPVRPVNGNLIATEDPGCGVAWDEKVVARSAWT